MISKALRLLRTVNDLNQNDLARELGISSSYLSQVESGKRKPTLELIESYSRVFKIPPSTILMFAEKLDANSLQEQSRVYVAGKILRLMELLAGDDNEKPDIKERVQPVSS